MDRVTKYCDAFIFNTWKRRDSSKAVICSLRFSYFFFLFFLEMNEMNAKDLKFRTMRNETHLPQGNSHGIFHLC